MSATDPLATVWDALAGADCGPHGEAWDFRARCPAHQGTNPDSLHVAVGVDGRAVVYCFARGCSADEIARALGLTVADLFAAGHRSARRRQLQDTRRLDFAGNARTLANALRALEELGHPWRGEIVCDCPYCGSENARLVVPGNPKHRPFLHCQAGCTPEMFVQALAEYLEDRKEAA